MAVCWNLALPKDGAEPCYLAENSNYRVAEIREGRDYLYLCEFRLNGAWHEAKSTYDEYLAIDWFEAQS